MNCQDFWDSRTEADGGSELAKHAAGCESCAAQLRRHRMLAAGLNALSAEMRHVEAPARVEAGLLAAYRTQKRILTRKSPLQWWLPAISWAATAAALIAVAVLLMNPSRPPMPAHRAAPGTVETASAETTDADGNGQADNEDGFIPLPNAEKLDPDEEVNVVRMEVPRSTMMAVGLPVNVDRVSELVEADVMLGADGMARAIRFVDE